MSDNEVSEKIEYFADNITSQESFFWLVFCMLCLLVSIGFYKNYTIKQGKNKEL